MYAARLLAISALFFSGHPSAAAGLENVCGSVKDQTGAPIADAHAELRGGGSDWNVGSDSAGEFCFQQIASGSYELVVKREGFKTEQKEVTVAPGELLRVVIVLAISTARLEVTVVEGASDPASLNVAGTKFNAGLIEKLPSESVNAAMSSVLTLATPGVAADSNGVFHPLGEHAETSFSVDGQPISDQQSRSARLPDTAATQDSSPRFYPTT